MRTRIIASMALLGAVLALPAAGQGGADYTSGSNWFALYVGNSSFGLLGLQLGAIPEAPAGPALGGNNVHVKKPPTTRSNQPFRFRVSPISVGASASALDWINSSLSNRPTHAPAVDGALLMGADARNAKRADFSGALVQSWTIPAVDVAGHDALEVTVDATAAQMRFQEGDAVPREAVMYPPPKPLPTGFRLTFGNIDWRDATRVESMKVTRAGGEIRITAHGGTAAALRAAFKNRNGSVSDGQLVIVGQTVPSLLTLDLKGALLMELKIPQPGKDEVVAVIAATSIFIVQAR